MKKIILITFGALVLPLLIVAGLLFVRPNWFLTPRNLSWALDRSGVFKEWSWKSATWDFEWIQFFERGFKGQIRDFCFLIETEGALVNSCLTEVSWDLSFKPFSIEGLRPITVISPFTKVVTKEIKSQAPFEPVDIQGHWSMLWNPLIPDLVLKFNKIEVDSFTFDLSLTKLKEKLEVLALDFRLDGRPDKIVITTTKKYKLPQDLGLGRPVFMRDLNFVAKMKSSGVPISLSVGIDALSIRASSHLENPVKDDFSSPAFLKKLLLATALEFKLPDVKKNLRRFGPRPIDILPAPLNAMNGDISGKFRTLSSTAPDSIRINGIVHVDLSGKQQVLNMDIASDLGLDLKTFTPGAIDLGLNFNKVALALPKFSGKSLPPQFFPDGRIIHVAKGEKLKDEIQAEEETPLMLKLHAGGDHALSIRSNLIDEPLRLNFDLLIRNSDILQGFLKVLPLRTKVFRRPVEVEYFRADFRFPLDPVVKGQILFKLPEYKITMNLEGPISKPRYAFKSEPPLPESDIYAVLLFGRPLAELDPDSKAAAGKTNKILQQGLLSLGVLYFLAGSPVEYVGFDPQSGGGVAQIGLGKKTSLRVGGGGDKGANSGIRHSLGNGWYLDTSVQNTTSASAQQNKSYGVILERIIAY